MAESRQRVPSLHNGISRQPPNVRFPNQVEDAENIAFSVKDGATSRPGSYQIFDIEDLPAGGNLRLHPIQRDEGETYLVLHGEGVLRIFQVQPESTASGECSVTVEKPAQQYLDENAATADDMRMVSIADYTLILNSTVVAAAIETDAYTVDRITRDQDTLLSIVPNPTDASDWRVRTEEDTDVETAGHWRFDPDIDALWGKGSWATASDADWLKPNGHWIDSTKNPMGFSVSFGRRALSTSSGSWNNGTLTLTITGAFAGYTPAVDDQINVTGGTGVTAGFYTIASKTSDDAVVLTSSIAAGSPTNVAVDGIGTKYTNVSVDFTGLTLADMHDVALELQRGIRALGGVDACVEWERTAQKFTITAPWRGSGSRVFGVNAPTGGIYDLTAATRPFAGSVTTVNGTGGNPDSPLIAPADRWLRIARPSDAEGVPDPSTMPVQLVRSSAGGLEAGPFTQAVLDSDPWVYYQFDETTGTTFDNATGLASRDGTLSTFGASTATLNQTGTIQETGSKAALFASVNTGNTSWVDVGGATGIVLDDGCTLEFVVKRVAAVDQRRLCLITDGSSATRVDVLVNASGSMQWTVTDVSGNYITWNTTTAIFTAATWFHIVCVFDPNGATSSDKMKVYLNGVAQSPTSFFVSGTASVWTATDTIMRVNGHGFAIAGIQGTYDAFAYYSRPLTSTEITTHYNAIALTGGGGSTFSEFTVSLVDWNERTSGSQVTNPAPKLLTEGVRIADMALHRNRLVLAGDAFVAFSTDDDLFNFFHADFDNLVDSDPFEKSIGSGEVALVKHIATWRKTLMIFTTAGHQFELSAPEGLTTATASLTPATHHRAQSARPAVSGSALHFAVDGGEHAELVEYLFDEATVSTVAENLAAHVDTLLPRTVRRIVSHGAQGLVFMLSEEDTDEILVQRSWFNGTERVQNAWSRWVIGGVDRVVDMAVLHDALWILVEHDDVYSVWYVPIAKVPTITDHLFPASLDGIIVATGVHSAGETTWTFTTPNASRNAIVLDDNFGANAGRTLVPTTVTDYTVKIAGNWTAGGAQVGVLVEPELVLNRPFARDRNGAAKHSDRLAVREVRTAHANTGAYEIVGEMPNRADRTKQFDAGTGLIEEYGNLRAFMNGNAEALVVSIRGVDARPFTISSVEFVCDHQPGRT